MRAIGIVLAGGNSKRMRELSNKRAVAAMPGCKEATAALTLHSAT